MPVLASTAPELAWLAAVALLARELWCKVVHAGARLGLGFEPRYWGWYSAFGTRHSPLPSALNMAPSHEAVMKADAPTFFVSYLLHSKNGCGFAYLGPF